VAGSVSSILADVAGGDGGQKGNHNASTSSSSAKAPSKTAPSKSSSSKASPQESASIALTPVDTACLTANQNREDLSTLEQRIQKATTKHLERDFPKLPKAGGSDWLACHEEAGQTCQSYYRKVSGMNGKPTKTRDVLCIQPLGTLKLSAMNLKGDSKGGVGSGKNGKNTDKTDDGDGGGASSSTAGSRWKRASAAAVGKRDSAAANSGIADTAEKKNIKRKSEEYFSASSPFLLQLKSFLEAFFPGMRVQILP